MIEAAEFDGVEVEPLVRGGFILMVRQRDNGVWVVTRMHRNPRKRTPAESGDGATLADALRDLSDGFPKGKAQTPIWKPIERI